MSVIISGIQQIGIGIPQVEEAWAWYRKAFGMDIPVFDEAAEANLMLPYTGGKPHQRRAVLALNTQGGGGMEIWQYTSRTPQGPAKRPLLGDLGINVCKIKAPKIPEAYTALKSKGIQLLDPSPTQGPDKRLCFYVEDPYQNLFQVVFSNNWFKRNKLPTGGVLGCQIGVSDIDRSLPFYRDILGYDKIVCDDTGTFEDYEHLPGGKETFRRVLLTHSKPREGKFSRMLGNSEIELIQVLSRKPDKIFEGRFWGDLGYIHLCFDIHGMYELKALCEEKGHPFTVDSSHSLGKEFDMGEASGHFSYVEDPDGTLIEFVEAHKIPIAKKLGWYLDLRKRQPEKPLPDWMLRALSLNRVR